MPRHEINPAQLPYGATVEYGFTLDGDRVPLSVTYQTASGKNATVEMQVTLDGDYVPKTGYGQNSDFHFPNAKIRHTY